MGLSTSGSIFALALERAKKANRDQIVRLMLEEEFLPPTSFADANELLNKSAWDVTPLTAKEWQSAEEVVRRNVESGIAVLSIEDHLYPKSLRSIPDPPPILYVKGNLGVLSELPGSAIVGTREASSNGLEIARRLGSFLAEHGWVVVSGLALGIDAAAHEGTLNAGGKTIAVLAHGLHRANPKKNSSLGERILDLQGAWVSEHPVGTEPRKEYFVPRNRIQTGLCAGSIIVEAKAKSGSVTQAVYCLKQKRKLFAVVPADTSNALNLVCEGTLMLVRDKGAQPIRSRKDYPLLLEALESQKRTMA